MSEQKIQKSIFKVLKGKYPAVEQEISVLNRCVDIVFINDEQELISMEVKLKDWRKALKQASDHQLYTDRSYICMPKNASGKINESFQESLEQTGIGLILISFQGHEPLLDEVVKAKKNEFSWESARNKVMQNLSYA